MTNEEFDQLKIEKELPNDIPTGFFEQLPVRTLQLAKLRSERRRKNGKRIRFILTFSAAALVLLLVSVVPPLHHRSEPRAEKVEDVLHDLSDDDLTNMSVVYGSNLLEE